MSAAQDFLNRLQIASPCPASWAEMSGDERARFCATCEKHVYDFSRMTAAEGMALIREKEGKVCGRLWRRADGTVITADCPMGKKLASRRSIKVPLMAAVALGLAALQNTSARSAAEWRYRAVPCFDKVQGGLMPPPDQVLVRPGEGGFLPGSPDASPKVGRAKARMNRRRPKP